MAEAGGQERTEAPTVKRREDARKEGQVAMSREVPSAALLGMFALYFLVALDPTIVAVEEFWKFSFENAATTELTLEQSTRMFRGTVSVMLPVVLGLFGLAVIVGLLASVMQVGVFFSPLKLHGERLNPINGVKRIFSVEVSLKQNAAGNSTRAQSKGSWEKIGICLGTLRVSTRPECSQEETTEYQSPGSELQVNGTLSPCIGMVVLCP